EFTLSTGGPPTVDLVVAGIGDVQNDEDIGFVDARPERVKFGETNRAPPFQPSDWCRADANYPGPILQQEVQLLNGFVDIKEVDHGDRKQTIVAGQAAIFCQPAVD